MFVAVNDILRSITRVICNSQHTINTGLFRIDAQVDVTFAGTQALCEALANFMHDLWSSALAGFMDNTTTLDGVEVQKVFPAPQFIGVDDTEAPTVGTVVGDALPPQDALVVSMLSDFSSRASRGRNYLCGFPEAAQDGGIWDAATTAAAEAWAAPYASPIALGALGTVRRVIGRPPFGGVEYDVTSTRVDAIVRSQRRRQRGVGQ